MIALLIVLLGVGPVLNHCQFSWTDNTSGGSQSFNVYIGIQQGGPYALIASVPGNGGTSAVYAPTTNFCATLPDGQKYAVVRSVMVGNESSASNEVPFVVTTVAPRAPTGLTVR